MTVAVFLELEYLRTSHEHQALSNKRILSHARRVNLSQVRCMARRASCTTCPAVWELSGVMRTWTMTMCSGSAIAHEASATPGLRVSSSCNRVIVVQSSPCTCAIMWLSVRTTQLTLLGAEAFWCEFKVLHAIRLHRVQRGATNARGGGWGAGAVQKQPLRKC